MPTAQALAIGVVLAREIRASAVRVVGSLTVPRSYGVYRLPASFTGTQRFRFGNHPVRERELVQEFGACTRLHLFLDRDDARTVAKWFNTYGS